MSDTPYLDQLIGSSASNEETEIKQIGAPTTVVAPQASPTFPEDFEAVEADEAYPILGNVTGIGAEIGTGLYLTKRLHRSQQFLKWARGAKAVSAAAIVTPEPASTAAGLGTFALSEAAIWGVSNVIGQGIRKSFGVQDNISAGEVLASSVFGVGLVTKGGQKLISLGDGLAQMKAWGKGNELFVQGAKSFVSGATLGIAETALRQEVQILLNERENRDAVEYLIGGAAGGGFNTMFDVFSRTGKWGQAKAKQVTSRAKEALAKKADELEARAETVAPRARPKLRLEANRIRQSINLVDDLGQQLDTASEALNNPKPKEAPATTATPKLETNLKPKNFKSAKETGGFPVQSVIVNGETKYIHSYTESGLGRLYYFTDEKGFREFDIDGKDVSDLLKTEKLSTTFNSRKELIDALQKKVEPEAPATPKENPEATPAPKIESVPLYHGGSRGFNTASEVTPPNDKYTKGFFLSTSREVAAINAMPASKFYANTADIGYNQIGDKLTEFRADLKRPYIVDAKEEFYSAIQTPKEMKGWTDELEVDTDNIADWALENGYDGVIIKNVLEGKGAGEISDTYVIFDNKSLKTKAELEPTPAPKTPEVAPEVTPRQQSIKSLKEQLSEMDSTTMSQEMPSIERDAKKIYTDLYDEISVNVRKLEKENNPEAIASLLSQIKELRELNINVKDVVETTAGRTLQAARRDASKYNWADQYSMRSQQEDAALALLEETLERGNVSGKVDGSDVSSKLDEVEKIKPKLKEQGKKDFGELGATPEAKGTVKKTDVKKKNMTDEEYKAFRVQLMTDIENALYKALDVDGAGKVTKAFRWLAQSRQMALINQLPSALAGVPTGIIALGREVNRGVANYVSQKFAGNELAGELAKADIGEALNNFKYLFSKDNWKAVGRTLKDNQSATDPRKAGRMDDEVHRVNVPRGEAALVASARRRAEKALKAKESLISKAGQEGSESTLERMNRLYFLGQSGGVRLIQGFDEAFKRPLIMGRVRASARKEAIMELHELKKTDGVDYTPADIDELAKQKFDAALIDSDGLMVLRANHEYLEEIDLARQELLFAANSDNIEEVVTPYSEKVVQSLKQLAGNDHPISFGLNAVMPYIGVPIRGVYKGLSWLSSVPRATGGLVGGDAFGNPYIAKVKQAQDELLMLEKLQKKRGDTPFDEKGLEAVNTLDGAKAELLEKINRADARRIQYNADNLADALMVVELGGLMVGAAALGSGTGSMTFLSEDQKKKLEIAGTKPFQLFGMDYKAIGPAAFPLVVTGDLSQYFKIRKVEAQMGTTILDEDLTWPEVILKSLTSLSKEQPLSSGVKQVTEMLGNDEQRKVAASSMLSSYTLMPAFAKKAVQQYNNAGRMVDLKGSTFADRMAYGALGMGIANYKTDYFGHDIEDPRGFIQNNVMRQWPTAKKLRTTLENVIGSDLVGTIQAKPEYIQTGIRMKDFIDARGVSMTYRFDQQLKETKINGKTMLAAVQAKIFNSKWRTKFEGSAVADGDIMVNVGLVELNELMRKYYDKTKEDILKDRGITSLFINKDNESLDEVIKNFNNGDFLKDSGPVNLADIISPQ